MDAVSIVEGLLNVNRDCCLGCGFCVSIYPEETIQLHKKVDTYIPPSTWKALYDQISAKKNEM
jgi:Fe-S-cluster-containing hydrogenase component 2